MVLSLSGSEVVSKGHRLMSCTFDPSTPTGTKDNTPDPSSLTVGVPFSFEFVYKSRFVSNLSSQIKDQRSSKE